MRGAAAFDPTGPLPDGRTLLEASAGTGKTHTITSLVLRLVAEERIPVTRLLVVTFTRAATAELRDRVRTRLSAGLAAVERALAEPAADPATGDEVVDHVVTEGRRLGEDELRERLRALRAAREAFDDATIATIHGFCQQALARAGLDADVDLDAQLTEDLTDLLEEVVDDFLVRELRDADDEVVAYLRDQKVDRADLMAIARRLEAEPDLRVHPDETGLHLRPDGPADRTVVEHWRHLVGDGRRRWLEGCAEVGPWLDAHREAGGLSGTRFSHGRVERAVAAITAWCDQPMPPLGDLSAIVTHLRYFSPANLEQNLVEGVPLAPAPPAVEAVRELAACVARPATLVRLRFARHALEEIPRRKRRRGVLSFSDLLLTLQRALADDASREALAITVRRQFDAALVDEFQDTDPVQWAVFDALFPPGDRLLLIGDPKQAIYAFRGADVATYLEAADSVKERWTLPRNFRSDQRYLDALNRLFDRPDAFGPGGIGYVPVDAPPEHRADRLRRPDGHRPALELRHVPREATLEPGASPAKTIPKGWADRWLPRHVAADVVAFLDSGATLERGDGRRPVEPGDVAVLTLTNRQADLVQAALRDAGVPAVVGTEHSVFATPETRWLQRVLDALVRVGAEREARAALATPLLGVSANELADLGDTGWDAWLARLEGWAAVWRRQGVAPTIRTLLAETGAAARLLSRPRGERSVTNVRHLAELLHATETARRLGPAGLAAWLREQRHQEVADVQGVELRLESDADAVQVLTVHRSKGLQYPVVWCPWLWEQRLVAPAERRTLRFHDPDDDGLAVDLDLAHDVDPKARHLAVASRERWEEGLRLAYVALTRAEHRCVVYTGAFKDSGPSALGHLLHGRTLAEGPDGRPAPPADPESVPDAAMLAELRALESDGIGVVEVTHAPGSPRWTPRSGGAAPPLRARDLGRPLDRSWQRSSFSRLVRDDDPEPGSPHAEGRDHDEGTGHEAEVAGAAAGHGSGSGDVTTEGGWAADVALGDLARGADAGVLLHGILEHLDFSRAHEPGVVEEVVADRLPRAGLPAGTDEVTLAAGLRAVVATPLGALVDDLALGDLGPGDRLDELDFDLPVAGGYRTGGRALTLTRIARVLADHAVDDPHLAAAAERLRARPALPVRGFLTGSIDLVARVGERVVVVDYKSNWLGERGDPAGGIPDRSRVADYHPSVLGAEMVAHDYLLQAHLYLVAVHRYLRWRLGATYDYDRHVGGVLYLFLRGMVGPDTPRDAAGTPAGVHARRPGRGLIEDLDAVLRGDR